MKGYNKKLDLIRKYQEEFVAKMLSYSLEYPNVLYCMNNETSTAPQWGRYWMKFIRNKAAEKGVEIYVTDMFDDGWKPLEKWIQVVEKAKWDNWSNVKSTFRTAELVKTKTRGLVVFNVGGNKYRLVTIVNFRGQIVVVDVALTHTEYDKGKWKE